MIQAGDVPSALYNLYCNVLQCPVQRTGRLGKGSSLRDDMSDPVGTDVELLYLVSYRVIKNNLIDVRTVLRIAVCNGDDLSVPVAHQKL